MVIAPHSRLSGSILAAALLLTCAGQLGAVAPAFVCNANSGVPPIVRADGKTELVSDVILNCTGGIPTPAGNPVPLSNVQIFLNTNVTSRIVGSNSLSEATLMIDEPLPPLAARIPDNTVFVPFGTPPPQVLCTPQGDPCPILGDGLGTPYETVPGTPTVYSGRQFSVNSVTWNGVPIDAPGNSITRVIRITNVRAHACLLGTSSSLIPTQILMSISITGSQQLTLNNQQLTVAFILSSLIVGGTTGTGLQCVSQNMPLAGPNFNIIVKEGFASSFKRRNVAVTADTVTPPAPLAQNIPGWPYNTESGFYNPALFTATPVVGLADYGTRIRIAFNGIPTGVSVFVPLQVSLVTLPSGLPTVPQPPPNPVHPGITEGRMVLIQTDEFGVDLSPGAGYSAVTVAAGTSGGVPVAAISASMTPGQGYAVYEVVNSDVNVTETATIPVSVAFAGNAGFGEITTNVSFAPAGGPLASIQTADLNAPIPRFCDNSVPRNAFTIGGCSAGDVTVKMVPFDNVVLVDGVMQFTPYLTHWTPGSMHTLSVSSTFDLGGGQRQAFSNWSDGGAQTHTVTAPSAPVVYQANCILQNALTTTISPAAGGTVAANPASLDGFYDAGTPVQLTASPAAGFQFSSWSGALMGSTNPQTVTMNSPLSVNAAFLLIGTHLTIQKIHFGSFTRGIPGASYLLSVYNAGAAPTTGQVTVTDTLPSGLSLVSMKTGFGWTCPGTAANNCTRSDALSGGASYPGIEVHVNVAADAISPQINQASVSGGGSATANASDSTTLNSVIVFSPKKTAIFRNGLWVIDLNGNFQWDNAPPDSVIGLGQQGDIPVVGDWNGDGHDKAGIFRNGQWVLDYNGNGVWDGLNVDRAFNLGQAGDIPVVGDWNGDGRGKAGIFRNGLWVLDFNGNGQWDGLAVDRAFNLGQAGDIPVVGDWNGDGRTKVGIFRNGLWVLDYNGNGAWDGLAIDRAFNLGQPGDMPVVGDWNGSGTVKAGIFRNGLWVLDYNGNGAWDGLAVDRAFNLGQAGDIPVVGDWNVTGTDKAGIFRNGLWVFDYNGNFQWDGPSIDRLSFLGTTGDKPVPGRW